jgi:hypothetical protein
VAADKETANKLSAVSKRIAEETSALERLKERLTGPQHDAEWLWSTIRNAARGG